MTELEEVTIEVETDGGGPFGTGLFGGSSAYRGWSSFELRRSIDKYATLVLTAPFEPEYRDFRDAFRPATFNTVTVRIGDAVIFTGQIIDPLPSVDPSRRAVTVTAYAKPAAFEDCTAPASLYPLEFKQVKLRSIAETLAGPFGIGVSVLGDQGAAFDKVALEPDQVIQEILAPLARQRGMVLTDTPQGDLWIKRPETSTDPVFKIGGAADDGLFGGLLSSAPVTIQPATQIVPQFRSRQFFTELTGIAPSKRRKRGANNEGSRYTVTNPRAREGLVRPTAATFEDVEKGELPTATDAKFGRMFGGAVSYAIETFPTWRDPDGNLLEPDTVIAVTAPEAMIYQETALLVRSVTFRRSKADNEQSAALELVLPGVFSGEVPERLPWDE